MLFALFSGGGDSEESMNTAKMEKIRSRMSPFVIQPDEEDVNRLVETARVRSDLASTILRLLGENEELDTLIPGLTLVRRTTLGVPTSYVYGPSLSMIVRGKKRVVLGDVTYLYDESRFLLTSLNLPTITQVLQASPDVPYVSVLLRLDLALAKQMIFDMDLTNSGGRSRGLAMATGPATASLFDALSRLVSLLEKPEDITVLAGLLQREFLYRILRTPAAKYLRQMVRIGTKSNKVSQAIDWLQQNYRRPFRVEDLAVMNGMRTSAFHHHFRLATAMTPLQYQKHLRLHEARRLMLGEGLDAGTAALNVGYESVTQFTREYRRFFGAPPLRDVAALRSHEVEAEQGAR